MRKDQQQGLNVAYQRLRLEKVGRWAEDGPGNILGGSLGVTVKAYN